MILWNKKTARKQKSAFSQHFRNLRDDIQQFF